VKSDGEALAAALPTGDVHTDRDFRLAVFGLARHLKAVPELRDRAAAELRHLIRQWHEQAVGHLGNRTATDTYAEFVSAWKAVRFAAGDDVIKLAWDVVARQPPPPEADAYDDARVGRLIALCRQLQHENELSGRGAHFFLGGRVVAELLKVTQPTAAKWLAMLVEDGILEITDPGGGFRGGKRMAREYRMARKDHPAEPQVADDVPGYDPF
jgi:hypothetical protein